MRLCPQSMLWPRRLCPPRWLPLNDSSGRPADCLVSQARTRTRGGSSRAGPRGRPSCPGRSATRCCRPSTERGECVLNSCVRGSKNVDSAAGLLEVSVACDPKKLIRVRRARRAEPVVKLAECTDEGKVDRQPNRTRESAGPLAAAPSLESVEPRPRESVALKSSKKLRYGAFASGPARAKSLGPERRDEPAQQ